MAKTLPIFGFNRRNNESYVEFGVAEGYPKLGFFGRLLTMWDTDGNVQGVMSRLVNQVFIGAINLCRDLTHYNNYSVATNIAVTLVASPVIGGSAEIRMIGDGSHAPVFDVAFTQSTGSDSYDSTLNAINKVVFYYDGGDVFYSITVL